MNYKVIRLFLSVTLVTILCGASPVLAATAPSLGKAKAFAVLGGSTVTNTGSSVVTGDLGVSPGSAITGFPPGIVNGTIHSGDAVAAQAQVDLTTAYNTLTGEGCDVDLTGQDLGGLTLTSGVYCYASSAQLTGTLTLDAQGNADAVFVFKMGSTITSASNSTVIIINGGQNCNVFWQVGSSATIGTTTQFKGNILALTSITLNTGAGLDGRALARNGAVTLDTNRIEKAACSGGGACNPTTCVAQGANCGTIVDGCGGTLNCGVCILPETCGGGGPPNVCGVGICNPTTCAAQGVNCGTIGDGCGGTLNCGVCVAPQTCGGGVDPNVCGGGGAGCPPESPDIWITDRIIGPPQIVITAVRDTVSGLKSIKLLKVHNATVSIPTFPIGTKQIVLVTVTKINQAKSASFNLKATNLAGSSCKGDPVVTVLKIPPFGHSVTQTFVKIPAGESFVAIVNGTLGLKTLQITVNGARYGKFQLAAKQEINVNVSSLMAHGENSIIFTGYGDPNASALVVISDSGGNVRFITPEIWMDWQIGQSDENLNWGNQLDE